MVGWVEFNRRVGIVSLEYVYVNYTYYKSSIGEYS